MSSLFTQLALSPEGLMLAGNVLARRAPGGALAVRGHEAEIQALLMAAYAKPVPRRVMKAIERSGALLAEVRQSDWDDRTPHPTHQVPVLAKAKMILALTGLGSMEEENLPRLAKTAQALREGVPASGLLKVFLRKDDSDDEDDEDESDEDGGDTDDSNAGGGHYNPDEPRIRAGLPGAGQWTTAGNGISYDHGSIPADDIRSALREDFDNYSRSSLPPGIEVAANDGTPGNNQAQNGQVDDVVRILGLNQDQRRLLHEEITGQNMGYHEILQTGRDMFNK